MCKRWDYLRHNVTIVRKSFASPRSIQYTKIMEAAPFQWSGWRKFIQPNLWIKVSCWIKFVGKKVPAPSSNFGLKLHGRLDNSWVKKCRPNTWEHISSIAPATGGDGNHIILIFDSIRETTTIRFTELKLEVLDSPQAVTPINEYCAFTNSDMSKQYVAMGVNRTGIPTTSGPGSMDFVADYPQDESK